VKISDNFKEEALVRREFCARVLVKKAEEAVRPQDKAVKEAVKKAVNRYVSNDFSVRAASVDATEIVQHMQTLQATLPLATVGVGRAMVGALLMSSHLKDDQEVGVLLKGNGPLGSVYAEASFMGKVRGYCPNPEYQAPAAEDVLNLSKAMGKGTITVVRHQPFQRQPFRGTVEMVSGEVGDDIAAYLHQSQQIRSIVSLGVYLDTYGRVRAAGGVLVEVMPGVEEEVVALLEANTTKHKHNVSQLILDGARPQDLVSPYLEGIPYTEIPHPYPMEYFCPCTLDRVKSALTTLGVAGIEDMIKDQEPAAITCQICGKKYDLGIEGLEELRDELR
jgi:molecular chaperone Hsp33